MGPAFDESGAVSGDTKKAKKEPKVASDDAEVKGAPEVGEVPKTPEPKKAEKEEPEPPEEMLDDDLDSAVDDIAASEGDELLKAEDEKVAEAFRDKPPQTIGQKIKAFFKKWWNNKKARNATFVGLFVLILILGVIPTTRYFILNTAGVRVKASVVVLDESTQQPLKNVSVSVGSASAETDDTGTAKLEKLKLGKNNVVIKKRAFAENSKTVTLGLGSNPLGNVNLTPTGVQYTFLVKDYLSGKPIEKAEAVAGLASAYSDTEGKLVITIDKNDVDSVKEATIKAQNYRDEKEALGEQEDEKTITMVSSHKHSFVTKRSGKYDLYRIDVDGKNEKLVLAGTGYEKEDISLVPHSTANIVAYTASRENIRNTDGFLLSSLMIVSLDDEDATPKTISQSERIQVLGWSGDKVIYVQVNEGESAADNKRHRLFAYDYLTEDTKELASANYFNDVLLANDVVYYAPSQGKKSSIGMFGVKTDGTELKTIIDQETWNIYRTSYDTLTFAVGQQWYDYKLGEQSPTPADGSPSEQKTRVYNNSPNKERSLWVDQRDGKGVLIAYSTGNEKDTVLQTTSGLKYPVSWLGDKTVVYRINTDQETADFAVSIDGGEPKKISDVTNTDGIDAWYYY